jgi:hypothetical protein
MKLLSRPALAFSALLLTTGFASAADAVDFKPQWLVGKRYYQQSKMNQESTISIGAQKMEQKVTMSSETVITVTAHEDGQHKRLNMKYGRIAMEMDMNGQKMAFDSAQPDAAGDAAGIGKILGSMAGKEVQVVLDKQGKVTDIENVEAMTAALDQAGPVGAQFKGMFSKDYFAQTIEQASIHNQPPGPVQPGATWPLDFEMNLPQVGRVKMTGTYTFQKMAEHGGVPCAQVASTGKLEMDINPNVAGDEAGSMLKKLGFAFSGGEITSTTWFDPKLGTTRGAEINQTMTMRMNNPTNAGESMIIPITQKVTMDLTKVEDVK